MWGSPKRLAAPPCPMPTSTVRQLSSRIYSLPRWHVFVINKGLGTRQHKFRFKNKLLSLDSTTISLCLTMFPWAEFRRAKGGVKAHVLLDHDDYLPAYVLLTEAKRSDVKLADSFRLNPARLWPWIAAISTTPCSVAGAWPGFLCHPPEG